jgi:hypothetical protein
MEPIQELPEQIVQEHPGQRTLEPSDQKITRELPEQTIQKHPKQTIQEHAV